MYKLFKKFTLFVSLVLLFIAFISVILLFADKAQAQTSVSLSVAKKNLAFEDNVYIMYAVDSSGIDDKEDIQLLVWNEPQTEYSYGSQDNILSCYEIMEIEDKEYSVFILDYLSAKQMTDTVYTVAYYNENYSAPTKYSILQYAKNRTENSEDENFKNLLNSMLQYGASAQIYYDYKTETLANATYYKVNVSNGTLPDGFNYGLYKNGSSVTVTASSPEENKQFKQWVDDENNVLSTNSTFDLTITSDITVTAQWQESTLPAEEETDAEFFNFILLDDDSYGISVADKQNLPENVVIPSQYNGKPVTSIGAGLDDLMENFEKWIPDSSQMIYAFMYCENLKNIVIPDSIRNIGYGAFLHCTNLVSVTFGANSELLNIEYGAFNECSCLTEITIPDSVTSIGESAFSLCSSLENITIGNSVASIGRYAFDNCSSLTRITIPDSVTSIGDGTFTNCKSLTEIIFPDNITIIEGHIFYGCNNLISVTLPDNITSIGDCAFWGCSNLTEITIPDNVTSIGWSAFANCQSLTEITIPDNVTSIGDWAFAYCSSLENITIGDSVASIGRYAFDNCSSLENVTIGNSVTSIGYDAFSGCNSLTDISFNGTIEQWTEISKGDSWNHDVPATVVNCSDGIYYIYGDPQSNDEEPEEPEIEIWDCFGFILLNDDTYCIILIDAENVPESIEIPSQYNDKPVTVIEAESFSSVDNLIEVIIPDSVTSIRDNAFCDCINLENVTIGSGVTSIGHGVFALCNSLTYISFNGTIEQWSEISKGDSWNHDVPATVVHCTDGDVDIF